jgi:hypothetical protein
MSERAGARPNEPAGLSMCFFMLIDAIVPVARRTSKLVQNFE